MHMDPGFVMFLLVFLGVGGLMLFRVLKFGGFKAAMFGAPIQTTVGEVAGSGPRMMTLTVKVHRLGGGTERSVGLELVAKSFASYQMMPVSLSSAEARKLAQLLQAASNTVSTGGQPL
jgi:hypothetical protein